MAPVPESDGQPHSIGARLAVAATQSRCALAEAQVAQLQAALQAAQVGRLLRYGSTRSEFWVNFG